MIYHIELKDGTIIASFREEIDRDMCIEIFRDRYPDCVFKAINGEIVNE